MLEFVIVLRSIGKKPRGIGVATLALKVAVRRFNGGRVKSVCPSLLSIQCSVEENMG